MNTTKPQIKEQEIQKITNSKKNQHIRDWVVALSPFYNTDMLLGDLANEATENEGKIEGLSMDFYRNIKKASFALGLSTHIPVAETVREEYRTFLVEMTQNIESEYGCKTAIEKALAEMIASSYVRTIQYSSEFNLCTKNREISRNGNDFYSIIGKELDRANRHFLNAVITLKQLKSPALELNIKAGTAFIGQNQQFNNKQDKSND